jgi:hypothetical protein
VGSFFVSLRTVREDNVFKGLRKMADKAQGENLKDPKDQKDLLVPSIVFTWEIAMGVISNKYSSQLNLWGLLLICLVPLVLSAVWLYKREREQGKLKRLWLGHPISYSLIAIVSILFFWNVTSILVAKLHDSTKKQVATLPSVSQALLPSTPNTAVPSSTHATAPTDAPIKPKSSEKTPIFPAARGAIHGSDNTLVGDVSHRSITGDGNTVVGPTNANGNTILNRGGTAIGRHATADPTSVAIGANAHAGGDTITADHGIAIGGNAHVENPTVNNFAPPTVHISVSQANLIAASLQATPGLTGFSVDVYYEYSIQGGKETAENLSSALRTAGIESKAVGSYIVGSCDGDQPNPGLSFGCVSPETNSLADAIGRGLVAAKVVTPPIRASRYINSTDHFGIVIRRQ